MPRCRFAPTLAIAAAPAIRHPAAPVERSGCLRAWRFGIFLVLAAVASPASAAEHHRGGSLSTQVNPVGLRLEGTASLKWLLSASPNPLLTDAHFAIGVVDQITPAYNRLGVWLELSPLSILDLRAGVDGIGYFGTFGHLVGFPSYDSSFDDDARRAIRDQARARVGARVYFSPSLKLKAGRVSFRASADFEWWRMKDAPEDFFYEPYRGTLLDADGDSFLAGANLLLVDVSQAGRVRVGVYHDYLEVYAAPQNRRQRLGPMVALKLRDHRFRLRNPVLYAGVLGYLEAPDRGGMGGFLTLGFGR